MDKRLCRHDERPALRVSALLKATTSRRDVTFRSLPQARLHAKMDRLQHLFRHRYSDVGFLHIRPRES